MLSVKEKRRRAGLGPRRITLGAGIVAVFLLAGIPTPGAAPDDPAQPAADAVSLQRQVRMEAQRPAGLFPGSGFWHTQTQVWALSIPKIGIDPGCLEPTSAQDAFITGTVSCGRGQEIALFAEDGKTELARVTAADSGEEAGFRLKIPSSYLKGGRDRNAFVQSRPAAGIAASRKVMVTISLDRLGQDPADRTSGQTQAPPATRPVNAAPKPKPAGAAPKPKPSRALPVKKPAKTSEKKKKQTISAPAKVVLTELKPSRRLKASASSGGRLKYRISDPRVARVSSKGRIIRKGKGKAVVTISQAGSGKFRPAKRRITVICRKSTRQEQIDAAVDWAIKIANDDRFAYGSGSGAHHFGCYFCGTNYGPRKHMKPSARYKRTYCCNPFVSAAYAHGAKHPRMLAACRRGEGIGMQKWTFYRYGCWKCVGKPAYSRLQKGDVMVRKRHVAMYVGGHKQVHASGGNWSAGSIAVIHMSRARYRTFQFVMRYTGY